MLVMGKKKDLFESVARENMSFFENGEIKGKKKKIKLKKAIKYATKGASIQYSKDIKNRENLKNVFEPNDDYDLYRYAIANTNFRGDKNHPKYFSAVSSFCGRHTTNGIKELGKETHIKLNNSIEIPDTQTIVIALTEKNCKEFNYLDDDVKGDLLRASTFGAIYPNLKNMWKKKIKQNENHDLVIMQIPDVIIFRDLNKKKMPVFKKPVRVNVIIICVPSHKEVKKILPGEEEYFGFLAKRIHHTLIDTNNHYFVAMDLSSILDKEPEKNALAFLGTAIMMRRFFFNFAGIWYFLRDKTGSLSAFVANKFEEKFKEEAKRVTGKEKKKSPSFHDMENGRDDDIDEYAKNFDQKKEVILTKDSSDDEEDEDKTLDNDTEEDDSLSFDEHADIFDASRTSGSSKEEDLKLEVVEE